LTPDTVAARIAQLVENQAAVRAQLQPQIEEVKQLALKSGQLLKTLLEASPTG
jgi:hypothetical protein